MKVLHPSGVSETTVELCTRNETIATALARDPSSPVNTVWKNVWPKPFVLKRLVRRFRISWDLYHGRGDPTPEDLDRAEKCGKFPYRPSDLFLKIFSDVLLCLERDPLSGICSPSLIGTSAVMPLTVISVIPDIMRHYYDCIVRAEKEVILATNYWQPSNSVNTISDSLRELSRRAGRRGQKQLPVKIMWDRGTLSQLVDNHAMVNQAGREALKLPPLSEIPNLHLEVINFHRPVMGTFHAKFLIVDRKVALLNSNNIQDRPNLEMMIHLEGPVVESFYDIFLYSWHHRLEPALPCLTTPQTWGASKEDYRFREENQYLNDIELVKASKAARRMLKQQHGDDEKLAALRKVGTREGQSTGPTLISPGGRIQDFLGGMAQSSRMAQSRRGSFADNSDEDLLYPEAAQKRQLQEKKGGVHFADVVMRAVENRRKSLSGPRLGEMRAATAPSPSAPLATGDSDSGFSGHTYPRTPQHAASDPVRSADFATQDTDLHARAVSGNHGANADDNLEAPINSQQRYDVQLAAAEAASYSGNPLKRKSQEEMPHTLPDFNFSNTSLGPGQAGSSTAELGLGRGSATSLPVDQHAETRTSAAHPTAATTATSVPAMATEAQPDKRPGLNDRTLSGASGKSASGSVSNGSPVPRRDTSRSTDERPLTGSTTKKGYKTGLLAGRPRSNSTKSNASEGPPGTHTPRQRALSTTLNAGALSKAWAQVEDHDVLDEFNPHTLHHAHDPFPIAMVNRKPHGLPGHQDIRVPQDAAWLAGLRYAQKSVFIQTPTFNAKPVVRAALEACRRGIQVTIWVDLGFNDKGESMPFQGGTNEEVVERMYKDLKTTNHQKNLHVFWYIGKDQVRPLNAVKKQRNCHVKFMQIDDQVGIQGNGNQDTQSWFHSCEVNVMVDSKEIVKDWMDALHRQQNTQLYGRVDDDGIWRDRATGLTAAELEVREEDKRLKALEAEAGLLAPQDALSDSTEFVSPVAAAKLDTALQTEAAAQAAPSANGYAYDARPQIHLNGDTRHTADVYVPKAPIATPHRDRDGFPVHS